MKNSSPFSLLLVVAVLTGLLTGCHKKPTQREVVEKYREPVEKLRAEIASYSDRLETDGRKPAAPLEPKPVLQYGNAGWLTKESGPVKSNLCIFPAEALRDLTRVWANSFSSEIRLDNGLGNVFSILHGTTVGMNDVAEKDLEPQVQGLLQTRYVGLFKPGQYVPAKIEADKMFAPATMGGDVWLFDRASGKLVFHAVVSASSSEEVRVLHDRKRTISREQWQAELYKNVKDNFLNQMMLVLRKDAGVEFPNWTPLTPESVEAANPARP